MTSSGKPVVIGGFILGSLALGVAAILFFGTTRIFNKLPPVVVFFQESVAGLEVGAPVTFHGVTIGSVKSISLQVSSEDMTARIPVFLDIDPDKIVWENQKLHKREDLQKLIGAGFRAQLAVQSLVTGQLRVDLNFHPDKPAKTIGLFPDMAEIPAIPSDLDQLKNKLTELPLRELAVTMQQTLVSIDKLSNHIDAEMKPVADSVRQSADAATRTLNTIDDAVRRFQKESSRLLISLNSLTEPQTSLRGDLEATMRDLAASASSLRNFSHALERDPSVLLKGRPSP